MKPRRVVSEPFGGRASPAAKLDCGHDYAIKEVFGQEEAQREVMAGVRLRYPRAFPL
jgi:hypothetical protein